MAESELHRKGSEIRRKLLGDKYVERVNATTYKDPVMRTFIDVATENVFGALWTRPGLDLKTRTLVCVVSDAATGREPELRIHLRMALRQGWTETELIETLIHLSGYVGVPIIREAMIAAARCSRRCRPRAETQPGSGARQLHPERAAGALRALHADAAGVGLHDAPGDGQAEAGARDARGGGVRHPVELVEDVRQVPGRDADAVVDYPDAHRADLTGSSAASGVSTVTRTRPPSRRVLDRVADQVRQYLLQAGAHAPDRRRGRRLDPDHDALGFRGGGERLHHVRDQGHQVDGLARSLETGLDLAEVEEVGHELGHMLRAAQDALASIAVGLLAARLGRRLHQELRGHGDRHDRTLQIVRDGVHEIGLHLLELLEQRDVPEDRGQADRLAVLGGHDDEAGLGGAPVGQRQLRDARPAGLEEPAERLVGRPPPRTDGRSSSRGRRPAWRVPPGWRGARDPPARP